MPRPSPYARRALVALALPLVTTACLHPSLGARQRALGTRWSAVAAPAPMRDDPFAGLASLRPSALIRAVLARNLSLEVARQAWRAALARYPQDTALSDPELGYGVGPASFGASSVRAAHRVDLAQEIPFPGKRGLRGEIALAEAEAAAGEYAAAQQRLASIAAEAIADWWLAERALALNREDAELLAERGGAAFARYESGEVGQEALLANDLASARADERELALRSQRDLARERLNLLLHRPLGAALPAPDALALDTPTAMNSDDDLASAIARRPELRAADARLRAREAAVALAEREFLPDFTLMASYDGFWQESELRPLIGMRIPIPLQLGKRRAALEEAQARLEGAAAEREHLAEELRYAAESARTRAAEARARVVLIRDRLVPAARDQANAQRAAFEAGRASFADWLDAEREEREIALDAARAEAALFRREVALARAGGWLVAQEDPQ